MTQPWVRRKLELARNLVISLYEERMLITWLRDRPEGWELVSGTWSPLYISMRDVPSRPALYQLVVTAALELIKNEAPDANRLLGLAWTGIPIAAAVGYVGGLPMSFNRKLPSVRSEDELEQEVSKYGGHRLVEGDFSVGDRVVVFDDVVTLFDSKEIAIRQLELELKNRGTGGVSVEAVAALVDRGRDAHKRAAEKGYALKTLVTLRNEGLDFLRGIASDREIEVLRDYINNYDEYQNRDRISELRAEAERKSLL